LPERFVLFLGTIEPRKNVARLIDAFGILVDSDPHGVPDLHLVIAGGRGWLYDHVLAQLERSNHRGRVHLVGYVPEEEKPWWYNAATIFCYPSLYEGFGLPPLEAMACGVPVIVSNASALPEVVGDAGITVPPNDTAALSEALRQLLADPELRLTLGDRGQARAKRFSWARAASQTAAVYYRALEVA
jgi:glycosyltransferase involved in cell wall biosynthesis